MVRLRDYGVPDFARIEAPKFTDGKLTFYAVDTFLGLPYKVETANLETAPSYAPLPLSPLPRPPRPAAAPDIKPLTAEEEEQRRPRKPVDLPQPR